jgi:glycosyltransferase involved in cell wall biosynthesis
MRPIRLALILDQQIRAGGGYQQAMNAALLTRELPSDICEPIFFTTLEENVVTLAGHGIQAELIKFTFLRKARTYLRRLIIDARVLKLLKRLKRYSPFERLLVQRKIDLVYFLAPSGWARDLDETNYITTVWDLCHRDDPEFPEVRWNRQFEAREKNCRALLPRATAIFVDSELGKKNVVHRYGIDEERVHVMPFQAAAATRESPSSDSRSSIDVRAKFNLDMPYVFYPAQFWAHKNHVYLLEGLRALEQRYGLRIGAIFSGGDQGNLAHVKSYVRKLNLEDRVRFVGFVDNDEIPELYRQSLALVMPSYFGPTNLPPLEAFELGVPVLYSDKSGLRDQVGDAALLMDLNDPSSMADHLKNLIDDSQLRKRLIEAGKERLKYFDSMDRVAILMRVLEDFRWRRLTWQ